MTAEEMNALAGGASAGAEATSRRKKVALIRRV
jgi:hypothetical protein